MGLFKEGDASPSKLAKVWFHFFLIKGYLAITSISKYFRSIIEHDEHLEKSWGHVIIKDWVEGAHY